MDGSDGLRAGEATPDPLQDLLVQLPDADTSFAWEAPAQATPDLPDFAWDEAPGPLPETAELSSSHSEIAAPRAADDAELPPLSSWETDLAPAEVPDLVAEAPPEPPPEAVPDLPVEVAAFEPITPSPTESPVEPPAFEELLVPGLPEPDLAGEAAPPLADPPAEPEAPVAAVPSVVEELGNPMLAGWEELAEAPAGEQHLVFTLAGAEYAVALSGVRAIDYPPPVTPLPHVPEWVLGVSSLRGDIISVIDLRGFLGLERNWAADRCRPGAGPGRLVVVQSQQDSLSAALLVDGVREIFCLDAATVAAAEEPGLEPAREYLNGLTRHAGRPLRVLDLERLLRSPEMRQFEPA
jgi:purine-binding chemotaxis protein CheW